MSSDELASIVRFLSSFARRQAAETSDFPGGFAVRNAAYARSHDNNQLLIADAADWPQEWYTRRGFVLAGRIHVFTRPGN
jgi:hypothetical protein